MALFAYLLVSLLNAIVPAFGLEIQLNSQSSHAFSSIDGQWHTLPIRYGPGQGLLSCLMSFWKESLFVLQPQCPVIGYDMLCPSDTPPSHFQFERPTNISEQVNVTDLVLYAAKYGPLPEADTLITFLHLSGEADRGTGDINLADTSITISQFIADSLVVWPSHLAKRLPLWNSLVSLRDLSFKLWESASLPSNLLALHLGSVEPKVSSSLHIGTYDDARIMGDILSFSSSGIYSESTVGIFSVKLGVEEGFLPLEHLRSGSEGYPIGPFAVDPRTLLHSDPSIAVNVNLEPGTPYMHLPREVCDSLAHVLNLTYEAERHIYLWKYNATHPIFLSPTYLEFLFGAGDGVGKVLYSGYDPEYINANISYTTVKIPFALLRPEFAAFIDPETNTEYPPAAYFPCSPIDPPPPTGDYIWNAKQYTSTLGRAFLQSAFVGVKYDQDQLTGTYWVAQAPGPANLTKNVLLPDEKGGIPTSANRRSTTPNAWTKSWSNVLPIWTVDADGHTLLSQRTKKERLLTKKETIITAVTVTFSTLLIAYLLYLCLTTTIKSHRARKKMAREIAEENEIARKNEAAMLTKMRDIERKRQRKQGAQQDNQSRLTRRKPVPNASVNIDDRFNRETSSASHDQISTGTPSSAAATSTATPSSTTGAPPEPSVPPPPPPPPLQRRENMNEVLPMRPPSRSAS